MPLEQFLRNALLYIGEDESRVDNVYINEVCELPDVWGCFKKGEEYVTYSVNERAKISYTTFSDPLEFFETFLTNSLYYAKFENNGPKYNR